MKKAFAFMAITMLCVFTGILPSTAPPAMGQGKEPKNLQEVVPAGAKLSRDS